MYYERLSHIIKGQDFIINGRDTLWKVEFYYERSRFLRRQFQISMMTGQEFHIGRSRFYYEWSKFSWWCITVSLKFRTAKRASHYPVLMGNCQKMKHMSLSIPYSEWCLRHKDCCCSFNKNGFIVKTNCEV